MVLLLDATLAFMARAIVTPQFKLDRSANVRLR